MIQKDDKVEVRINHSPRKTLKAIGTVTGIKTSYGRTQYRIEGAVLETFEARKVKKVK